MPVIRQPTTHRLTAVPPLFKMCHFIVSDSAHFSREPDMISHNIKWMGSKGIAVQEPGWLQQHRSGLIRPSSAPPAHPRSPSTRLCFASFLTLTTECEGQRNRPQILTHLTAERGEAVARQSQEKLRLAEPTSRFKHSCHPEMRRRTIKANPVWF